MSSRMFQGVLLQLSEAAQTTIGVIDAEGNVISCSDTTLIGEKWPDAATAVAAMLENPVREEPYTFYALKAGTLPMATPPLCSERTHRPRCLCA